VRPTTSCGLNSGGWTARPVRGKVESGDKIKERVECSEDRGRGGKGSFIVAKRRGGAMPDQAGLNRKRQRTGNDFTAQRSFPGNVQELTAYPWTTPCCLVAP
jgi:hypothetical protein